MGHSPAQLLMGRQLKTTLPLLGSAFTPVTPCWNDVAEKDAIAKERQTFDYKKRHRVQTIPARQEGEDVLVPDIKSWATIIETLPYRSYRLQTESGRTIRRNERALRLLLPEQHLQHDNDSNNRASSAYSRFSDSCCDTTSESTCSTSLCTRTNWTHYCRTTQT